MDTHFLDTTIIYYRLHGHSLLTGAVHEAVGRGTMTVSNFVRGEYIRGYVTGLIELFFAIREEGAVEDGIHAFNAEMGNRPRKIANALQSTAHWLCGLEDWRDVARTLRRLGEYIRGTLHRFDMTFPRRARDPLECEIGVLSSPQETYDDSHILDFYEQYERIREGPTCNQCGFRQDQEEKLRAAGIDLYSEAQRNSYAKYKGYVKQAEAVDRALRSELTAPSCWYCDRLGDTIIALSAPAGTTILTGDQQSFPALASILGKPLELIPSLAELRKRRGQH